MPVSYFQMSLANGKASQHGLEQSTAVEAMVVETIREKRS